MDSPRVVAQRQQLASMFAPAFPGGAPVVQKKGHKPKPGTTVRYPATGPGQGDEYTVVTAQDDGSLQLRKKSDARISNRNWKNDNIWLVRDANVLDTDRRIEEGAWTATNKSGKAAAYAAAKSDAVDLIKAYLQNGMLNATNWNTLNANLSIKQFNKVRKGEWRTFWEEGGGRKWQLTIDMDNPEEKSDQEPHVGWEVKLIDRGKKGNGDAQPDYAKGQGHVWLNEVPEWRGQD
jgi:hypothetical protein